MHGLLFEKKERCSIMKPEDAAVRAAEEVLYQ